MDVSLLLMSSPKGIRIWVQRIISLKIRNDKILLTKMDFKLNSVKNVVKYPVIFIKIGTLFAYKKKIIT